MRHQIREKINTPLKKEGVVSGRDASLASLKPFFFFLAVFKNFDRRCINKNVPKVEKE